MNTSQGMKLLLSIFFKYIFKWLIISFTIIFLPFISLSQIVVDTTKTPEYLVENILVGAGVSVSNITYSGSNISLGNFTNGNSTNIGIDKGIILSTGDATHIVGPNSAPNTQYNTLGGSDPDLATLVTNPIYDAAVLEFDFIPMSDTIRFQYVFGSEEYSEWVNTGYNDAFGFFLTGANPSGGSYVSKNLAIVPGTTNTVVSINTINNGYSGMGSPTGPCTNCAYYIDNYQGTTIEYDGFTVVLTTWLVVTPCTSYHIKLAIGDGGDHSYDSGVLLKKNSFSSDILHINTDYTISSINNKAVEGCNNALVSFTLDNPSPYNRWVHYTVAGTATEGADYQNIPDSVLIPSGSDSVSFYINPLLDGITEGIENVEIIVETSSCSSDTLIIPIYDYQSLETQITGNSNFCIGTSSTLNSNVSYGFAPYSYSWNTGSTSTAINISPNVNTTYSLQVTDACGLNNSDTILITVNPQPNIIASSNPTTVCNGQSAVLQANGANTYLWSPSSSLSSNTGSNVSATPNITTTYTVIGTDLNGCKDTTQTILTIKSLPIIQTLPSTSSICIGDSIDITASGGISYQWAPSASLTNSNSSSLKAFPNVTTTYTVIGTAANGCEDSTTSVITVNNLPNVQITPSNPTTCIGSNKSLYANGASTYIWTPSASLLSNTGSHVVSNATTTTTYIVEGTDIHSCKNTDTVSLTVYSKPSVTVLPVNVNICEGSSTVINASGGATYSWSPASGLSSTTGSSVTASPNVNSTYTVTAYDTHGCSDTAITHITVSPNPVIAASDTVICVGENIIINATASLAGTTFLWNTGSTNDSIDVSPIVTTLYHVTATDGSGCVGYDSVNITVNQLPVLTINPPNASICIGNNVSVTASGANTYSWSPNTNISNINNATTTLSPTSTSTYTVTGIDANGCIDSTSTTIAVNPLPNIIINPKIDSICWGASTSLTASGGNTYHWTPAGGLSSVNTSTVTANPLIPTTYVVSGTDANGCVNTDTAVVFVSPVVSVTANQQNICLGDSSNLIVSSNVASTYLWSTGETLSNFWVKPTDTTTYTVTVTTAAGCQRVESVTVNVYLRPHVVITPDSSSICAGETTFLTASGAVNYTWQANPSLNTLTGPVVSAHPTANDSFMVIGEDLSGCLDTAYAELTVFPEINITVTPGNTTTCQGTAVNIKSSGAQSYSWTPSASLNISTGDSVMATPNSTTTYKVVGIDNNGCRDSAQATVHINAKPIITITPDTSNICIGESQSLHASGAFTYTWSPLSGLSSTSSSGNNTTASPAATTTYTIIGTSQVGGCKDTATAYVGVHSYPTITLTPAAVQICPQDSTTLTAGGADLYSWNPSLGLSDTSSAIVKASPDSTQIYTLIGSNLYGCTDTLSSTITVSPIPIISGNNYICAGDSTTLNAISNLAGTTFVWNTGSTDSSITVSPLTTATYTLTATDIGSGCTNDTAFVVNVNAIPSLSLSPNDTTICPGTNVILTAQGGSSYLWSPSSSLSSSTNSVVSATPASNTIYQLVGSTTAGCKDTVYANVKIFSPANVNVTPVTSFSCGGSSQMLTATGAASYSWTPSTGLSVAVGSSVIAGPDSNTAYTVTGIDTNNCSDTAIANIYIYGNPNITPANPSICPEDSVLLTANTQNTPLSYLWSTGDTTSSIYAFPNATSVFSVTVTYPGGCDKSEQTTVTVYMDASVSATTSTPNICIGDTANLSAQNCTSYSWTGLNLLSSTGNNVNSVPNTDTSYIVRGLSVHSCATFDTVDIHIHPITNVIIASSQTNICLRDTLLLIASGAQDYSWSPNLYISGLNGDSVNVFPHNNTNYIVEGTDSNGCIDYDTILINVNLGPVVTILPDSPIVCQGDTINLIAAGATTYTWWPLISIANFNNDTADIFPVSNITYHVRGYDSAGCWNDTSVYVNVKRKPFIGVIPNLDSICIGDSILLTAYGASTYYWQPSSSLSDTTTSSVMAGPTSTTTYCIIGKSTDGCIREAQATIKVNPHPLVTVTSSATICKFDTAVLIANGALNYQWSPLGNISSNVSGDTANASPLATTTYKAVGTTIHGCRDSAYSNVNVLNLPNIQITPTNPSICYGDSTQLTASGGVSYSWSPTAILSSTNTNTTWASPLANSDIILTGTDIHNCVNRDTASLIVHPDVVPTAIPSQDSICYGLSTNLSAGGGVSYQWTPATGLSNTNSANVTANPLTDQTYKVKVYDAFNCVDSIDISVKVLPLPIVQLNAAASGICIYDTTFLWAQGAKDYLWSPNVNLSNIIDDTTFCNPISTQKYFVQGTDSLGCINTDSTVITVYDLPNIQIILADTAICYGDSTQLNASGGISYNWSPNIALSSTTNNQVTTTSLNSIWYYLTGTDANTCINSDSVEVKVRPRPQLSITSTDSILCSGYYLGLSGQSNMNPTSFIWSTGDTTATISDNPTANITYKLKGINTYNCADSTTIDILVNQFPTLQMQSDTIICLGDTISASTSCNLSNLTFLWSTGDTTMCIPFSPTYDSTYILTATDSIGCSDTLSTTISVQSVAGLDITANSTHICANSLLTLTANTIYPVVDYQWNIGNNTISNNYYPTTNSSFNLIATDSIGCNYYDTIDIQVNPIPVLQISSQPPFICIGDTAQLSVSSSVNPINLFWNNTGQTTSSINVNPSQTTIYKVSAADSIGCIDSTTISLTVYNLPVLQINPAPAKVCFGDSIQLQTTSNNTITNYLWNDNTQQANNWVTPINTTTFSVTATDNHGCVNDTQRTVFVNPNPIIQITPAIDTICGFDSTQLLLTSNIPSQSILWSTGDNIANPYFGPMNSTYYSAIFTDTNGCYGYDTAFVYVIQRPTAAITAQSPICSFDSSRIEYQGSGTANAITNWDFGTANSVSGNGLADHYAKWDNAGIYQITLDITENGCTSFPDTAMVTVFQSPIVEIFAADTSVCDSFAVDFSSLPYGMQSYHWNFGDPLALGSDTSDLQNPSYTYNTAGSFSVSLSVVSVDGCLGYLYQDAMIDVNPVPMADYIVNPPISYSNNPIINFYNKSSMDVNYWEWNFGNPQSGIYNYSNNENPYHIYQTKGTFFTQLVVKNQWGCSDTAFKIVIIENGPTFYIPDAFTPNGDGLNDNFLPKGTDFIEESFEIYIYERWGSMVFESHDFNHQWDGKHYKTGQELPDGVYSYIIYVTDIHDVKRKYVGNIIMYR